MLVPAFTLFSFVHPVVVLKLNYDHRHYTKCSKCPPGFNLLQARLCMSTKVPNNPCHGFGGKCSRSPPVCLEVQTTFVIDSDIARCLPWNVSVFLYFSSFFVTNAQNIVSPRVIHSFIHSFLYCQQMSRRIRRYI